MKESHSKGLKVKPSRDFGSLLEAFVFQGHRRPEVFL